MATGADRARSAFAQETDQGRAWQLSPASTLPLSVFSRIATLGNIDGAAETAFLDASKTGLRFAGIISGPNKAMPPGLYEMKPACRIATES
jgi:hypothetical protein